MGTVVFSSIRRSLAIGLLAFSIGVGSLVPAFAQEPDGDAALVAIKDYLTEHVDALVAGATDYQAWAAEYYALAEASGFDYDALWAAESATLPESLAAARETWATDASGNYELAEGIVAGVPSLAYFDVWLDAGPSAEEDAANAYVWTLTLADGTTFENPGNIFHHITEPALYGTSAEHTGLEVDLDGDGVIEVTESLPEAVYLLGGADALLDTSTQLQEAVAAWEPTLSDAFTALVVMLPTAGDYFEQWKISQFVSGDAAETDSFVGVSRLVDVLGIYNGLSVTWDNVGPLVAEVDPALAETITIGIADIIDFVQDIRDQEIAGTVFTAEEVEQYGAEVQVKGDTVAGYVTQAAALLDIELAV